MADGGTRNGNDEIEWLFSQELPLFVCTVDQADKRFRLYSTSAMWLLRHQYGHKMASIELCPDAYHDPLKESRTPEQVAPEYSANLGIQSGCSEGRSAHLSGSSISTL